MLLNGFIIFMTMVTAAAPAAEVPADKAAVRVLPPLFVTSARCMACHNGLISPAGRDVSIGADWQSTMMAHSAKDPYWHAAVRREVTDHPSASAAIQNECSACHMPMDRFQARAEGRMGEVFRHLPMVPGPGPGSLLAADGVSCTICHQIRPDGLGTRESFTAGFVVDTAAPPGDRLAFGPFDIDGGRKRLMRSSSGFRPERSGHVQKSEICASCHTLYTHSLGPDGEVVGELPEQVPYLEWKHSAFADRRHCQSCHMPQIEGEMPISNVLPMPRKPFSRHAFRGGNFFMPAIFNMFGGDFGVTTPSRHLDQAARQTADHLSTSSARLKFRNVEIEEGILKADLHVTNMAGHKLPTAYPSRRAWIHLTVKSKNEVVFESGGFNPDGSISGNDNDMDPAEFEPHYDEIISPQQVQIYEAVLAGPDGEVTTGLITAVTYIKDSRILPAGFDKASAHEDIAVHGAAAGDEDFKGGTDVVTYAVGVDPEDGPFVVEAELWYQPIGFRWARNLGDYDTDESARFISYFEALSEGSGIVLATARVKTH